MEVTLQSPFPEHAWPRVWTWMSRYRDRVADDYAPRTLEAFVELQMRAEQFTWGVLRDGELGGLVSFQPVNRITGITHCLFKREFWGRETTVTALRLAYDLIFKAGVLKLQSYAFEDNHAVRSMAKFVGAREVPHLFRAATMRGGKPIAIVMFEIFPEDFYASTGTTDRRRDIRAGKPVRRRVETDDAKRADLDGRPDQHAERPVRSALETNGEPHRLPDAAKERGDGADQ